MNTAGIVSWKTVGDHRVIDNDASAEMLLSRGADVNARNVDGETLLHFAARWGCMKVLQLVLDRGAEVDARGAEGMTPLHYTLRLDEGRPVHSDAAAELLLARGADINASDEDGRTLLHVAAGWGCVRMLHACRP
mmetsp:Transcript_4646/g.9341  ORF Transcript_4646/g.9341 Transcript_4646/m.9341 type:complete len:135 (+) Transcript_4646:1267-1671(+)